MDDLRYPAGRFVFPKEISPDDLARYLDEIEQAPALLRAAVAGLSNEQLDTPYRPEGWTVRQVVHHVPDSHINSYVRFRWALTEDEPTIKAYEQQGWAALPDARTAPVETSLALLEALHTRWMVLLRSLDTEQLGRSFRHPELGSVTLEKNVALYAWHGRHHVAHVTALRKRMGWS